MAVAKASVSQTSSGPPPRGESQADPKKGHDHSAASVAVGSAKDRGKLVPGFRAAGLPPVPVETPDVPQLEWKMVKGVKEFHLYAQHMKREFLPDLYINIWSYDSKPGPKAGSSMPGMPGMLNPTKEGPMPGPTIQAIEGERVRIVVHNDLPEATSMHWHGLEVLTAWTA